MIFMFKFIISANLVIIIIIIRVIKKDQTLINNNLKRKDVTVYYLV